MTGTERGERACSRCEAPNCPREATHLYCGECGPEPRGVPLCDGHSCRVCDERPRAPSPCPGCETLRSLLRLALGKLRDVQRADVTGAVNSLEKALDEVGR